MKIEHYQKIAAGSGRINKINENDLKRGAVSASSKVNSDVVQISPQAKKDLDINTAFYNSIKMDMNFGAVSELSASVKHDSSAVNNTLSSIKHNISRDLSLDADISKLNRLREQINSNLYHISSEAIANSFLPRANNFPTEVS